MSDSKKYLILCILLFSSLLAGCNNRVVIEDLEVKSDFYQQNGYLLGNSRVELEVKLAKQSDQDLTYYWKATRGSFLTQGRQKVIYETPKLPGDYNLTLVVKRGDEIETTFNFPFVVKGDYPNQVKLKKAVNHSLKTGVKLDWSEYEVESGFYSYKILRSNDYYINDQSKIIAQINNQNKSYYVDKEVKPNQNYTYQILVINKRGYLSVSNEKTVQVLDKGVKKIDIKKNLSDLVLDKSRSLGYITVKKQRQLLILDTKQDKVVKKIQLSITPEKLVLTPEDKFLFILAESGRTLIKINLNSLVQKRYTFANKIYSVSSSKEYLYLLTKGEDNLIKFNPTQGIIADKETIMYNDKVVKGRKLKVIADDYLVVDILFGPTVVYNLSDLSKLLKTIDLGAIKDIGTIIMGNKRYLYIVDNREKIINSWLIKSDSELVKQQPLIVDSYPQQVLIKKNSLLVNYNSKKIDIFSLDDYRLKDAIKLDNYIYDLVIDKSETKVYLLTDNIEHTDSDITVVNLRGDEDH
ncbi:hypothetical protein JCM16358_04860 [Halanaerocella petrolearia]